MRPDDEPMVATAVLLLVHVPPVVASASVAVAPTQADVGPVMGENAFTVSTTEVKQPPGSVYVIVGVPGAMPPSRPDADPMVPCAVLLLVQVPPEVASESIVVWPTQTDGAPVIAAGEALTVNEAVLMHPAVVVYVIVTTPGATPVTVPLLLPTVAIVPSLLVHVPPRVASVSVRVEPAQTLNVPTTAAGSGFTVTTVVALQPANA
jgi:hypothetical protein